MTNVLIELTIHLLGLTITEWNKSILTASIALVMWLW